MISLVGRVNKHRRIIGLALVVVGVVAVLIFLSLSYTFMVGVGATQQGYSLEIVSCPGNPLACTLRVSNIGAVDTSTTSSCTLTFGGTAYNATSTVVSLKAGERGVSVACTASGRVTATPGTRATVSIKFANGGGAYISGTSS